MIAGKTLSIIIAAAILTVATGCDMNNKNNKLKSSVRYEWSNVAIGGGGYITGIIYNPKEQGLIYARTDIGGAYRFDKNLDRWIPITDHLGFDEWNLIGIESLAADPVEANRIYAACGTYMSKNGAILSSDDYGNTWKRCDVEFGFGGNQSGRGSGERLAVNPHRNSEIYCGTRDAGLWRSSDYGMTWSKVESFPVIGDYRQEDVNVGIMWVNFDPSSDDIYAGAAMTNGECIYRSTDGGASWSTLPVNVPGMFPLQAEISQSGIMYLIYNDTAGPNVCPENGAVYALNLKTESFTDITPDVEDGHYGGYGAVALDASDPNTLIVTSLGFWNDHGDNIYRTTNGGKTWNSLFTRTEKNYVMDTSQAQWLDWGRNEAKTGWWISAAAIDPFDSDILCYGTGASLFSTENLTDLGSAAPVKIGFDAQGIEETAVYDIISPPTDGSSPALYSIMGDLTGFSHLDISVPPDDAHFMKNGDPEDLDAAWLNGNIAVYTSKTGSTLNFTTDGGASWQTIDTLPDASGGGKVAVSCDGSTIMWRASSVTSKTYVTPDFGKSWFYAEGLGLNTVFEADKADPNIFYAVCDGTFYISTDGGYYFEKTGAYFGSDCTLTSVGGNKGHIWAVSGSSAAYSEDFGKNFTVLDNISVKALGFGAPASDRDYMTIYAVGCVNAVDSESSAEEGIYRSCDKGRTWQKINDDMHLFGNLTPAITGDSEIFGRVYLATNGRGIVMGGISE